MKLTAKEVEAASRAILDAIRYGMSTDESDAALDALCAAAREPESSVGKLVRFSDDWSETGVVLEENLFRIQPNSNPDFNSIVRRDEFEVLEGGE